jgi:hypothetical protein
MKPISLAGLLVILFASACNNAGEGNDDVDTTTSNIAPVENVNGNIPDTTNSINVDPGDTTSSTPDTIPR